MKQILLIVVFACCTLAVVAQEEGLRVNFQGAQPTIKDFAQAYITSLLNPEDEDECEGEGGYLYENLQRSIACQAKGLPESWGQVFDSIITFLAYRRLSREVH